MPHEMRLRRCALEIMGQLPENPREARLVLNYARDLLDGFLAPHDAPTGTTANLRAISSDRPASSASRIHPTVNPGICRAKD